MKASVPIVYFFQSDPKVQHIKFHQSEDLTVRAVASALNLNRHHLRFKIHVQDVEPKMYAWFDISNPAAKCPIINDTIHVKILELKDLAQSKIAKKLLEPSRLPSANAAQPPFHDNPPSVQPKPPPLVNSQRDLDLSNKSNDESSSNNILESFEGLDYNPKITKSNPVSQVDLEKEIQKHTNGQQKAQPKNGQTQPQPQPQKPKPPQQTNSNNDQFPQWQEIPPAKPSQAPAAKPSSQSQVNLWGEGDDLIGEMQGQKLVQEKGANENNFPIRIPSSGAGQKTYQTDKEIIDNKVDQKVSELKKQWEEEETYNNQKEMAKNELEVKIMAWAYRDKTRNNLRLLLTSLNDVLWEGESWNCSIGDLMNDAKLKMKYMAAIRIVHPDKSQFAPNYQQRYIAERVFYELNQAWNDLKKTS